MKTIEDFGNPMLYPSDRIDAHSAPSPPVLGGRGRGEGGQAPMLEDHIFAWDANPPSPLPLSPRVQGEREKCATNIG